MLPHVVVIVTLVNALSINSTLPFGDLSLKKLLMTLLLIREILRWLWRSLGWFNPDEVNLEALPETGA